MFSDNRGPGEHKGFKTHGPHFLPWLRNSLKPHQHHDSNLGLNGAFKSGSESRNHLKGMGFFSIQGKDKEKKRCNGVGMARMLPVVLRGHHILTGKQQEDSPARWKQSPELDPEANTTPEADKSSSSVQDNHTPEAECSPQNIAPSLKDQACTPLRRYGPLVVSPPAPPEECKCTPTAVVRADNQREKVWDYSSQSYRHRDLHSSNWADPETQGTLKRHQFTSSFSFIHQQTRNSQSHRDLSALRDTHLDQALNGVLFSTEVTHRGPGCTTTLRGPRKPRPSSERITSPDQSWFQPNRTHSAGDRKQGVCSRKAVRNQIKRVVDNLEQVLGALRDVQQEMKEVVQQIDYLTSSIDLNQEEQPGAQPQSSCNSSCSSDVTVGSVIQRPSDVSENKAFWRDNQTRRQSPPSVLVLPITSARTRTLQLGSRQGGTYNPLERTDSLTQTITSPLSPQRTLPVRPPTPGLSPLTVNLQHPSSPVSQPQSPSPAPSSSNPVSPQSPFFPKPPPSFGPSVIKDAKPGCYQTPQKDHPSVTSTASVVRPPTGSTDRQRRAFSAGPAPGPSQMTLTDNTAKPRTGQQSRRGRKPPPYPHHRLSDNTKAAKEPRKAPPYPEKRRLLLTTV